MNEDEILTEARARVLKEASDHSFRLRVIKEEAAQEIARKCDIGRKPHDPAAFVDVAMQLLSFPPELGFVVAQEFTVFASKLGFQPYGTILVAVGRIDSLYTGMFSRVSHLRENPQLAFILESKPERLARASKLLITGLLLSTRSAKDTRTMFANISADPTIKELMRVELIDIGLGFIASQRDEVTESKPWWKLW